MTILVEDDDSGVQLLFEQKFRKERFAHLRVYRITAYDDERNCRKAMEYDAEDYLAKPIDFNELNG